MKFAVILPFVALIILILSIEVIIWKSDYEFLAKEQGTKIVHALNDTIQERLTHMLIQPLNANVVISKELITKDIEGGDLESVEAYLLRVFSALRQAMPQISVVGYGDEQGRYIGFRANPDNFSLMLKDSRTMDALIIYEDETTDSNVIASYDQYDPRQRPWYRPVKENPTYQWSDIYVNYDEQMESTITFLAPVMDDYGVFKGVMAGDVKLNGINHFLKMDTTKGSGVIYIVDEHLNIIAHSGEKDIMTVLDDDSSAGQLMQATNSEDPLIRASAHLLNFQTTETEKVMQQQLNNKQHYMLVSKMRSPQNLDWRIVVIIPETDLMGNVQQRNQITFTGLILISIIGLGVGLIVLNRITNPIIESTSTAVAIAKGNWAIKQKVSNSKVKEIDALSKAIATLGQNIQDSFETIQFNEERYRSLVENVDSSIYSLTTDGYFISVNSAFEKATNKQRGDIIGDHFTILFNDQTSILFWTNFINEVCQSKKSGYRKFEYDNFEGKRSIVTTRLIPLLNEQGDILLIIGANTDVTNLIEAEEEIASLHAKEKEDLEHLVEKRTVELERAMKELFDKEKLASLGRLVSGIAHEINTPLGVAISASSLLDTNNKKTVEDLIGGKMTRQGLIGYMEKVDETTAILTNNLVRASNLIKSFKEIAVNQSAERKKEFNVYDYINAVLVSLKHEYKSKRHRFNVTCDRHLVIYSYSGAFSQILTHLIMNSIIHGFKESTGGHITIQVERHQERIRLIYKDDGSGMEEDVKKRIFEPFYTTNRNLSGSGLGLNIVYNIITGQLNGTISCDSRLNEGTSFIIEFEKD